MRQTKMNTNRLKKKYCLILCQKCNTGIAHITFTVMSCNLKQQVKKNWSMERILNLTV